MEETTSFHRQNGGVSINATLGDDELRAVLHRLDVEKDKEAFGLVCKRWLHLQNTQRKKVSVRVGVIIIPRKHIMGKVDEKALKTLVVLIFATVCILIIGCVCIFILTNGVSKEMKLRAELISHLDARRKAEASSNYKSQFLANMSHELRTPMAAVIGLLDILISDDCLTNEQYGMVTQIRRCSNALLRLLNNILDLSKCYEFIPSYQKAKCYN